MFLLSQDEHYFWGTVVAMEGYDTETLFKRQTGKDSALRFPGYFVQNYFSMSSEHVFCVTRLVARRLPAWFGSIHAYIRPSVP